VRTIDKYLTESVVKLNQPEIKRLVSSKKSGTYDISGKKVSVIVAGSTMVLEYPSTMYDLTYILIDISDDMKYKYQQIGMNSQTVMKFIISFS
jgi:hypothetical protein